jgi:hypothetical protein
MSSKPQTAALVVAALILCMWVPTSTRFVQAQEATLSADDYALYMATARMCANEAFGHRADCLLIWQTIRKHGRTSAERLTWLTNHSNCVLRPTDPPSSRRRVGNCRWVRHLRDDDSPPSLGWPSDWRWEGAHQMTWTRTRTLVMELVQGRRPRGGWPCRRDPDTWAGRVTDAARILEMRHRLEPLQCTDPLNRERPTLNDGFVIRTTPLAECPSEGCPSAEVPPVPVLN